MQKPIVKIDNSVNNSTTAIQLCRLMTKSECSKMNKKEQHHRVMLRNQGVVADKYKKFLPELI